MLLFALLQALAGPGVDVGSGGDLVRCAPHPSNDLAGLYSLDYLVMRGEEASQPASVTSYNDSLFRIRRILVDKLPELLPHFDDFANNLFSTRDDRPYKWEDTEYEVVEIDDEKLELAAKPPHNCRQNGKYRLVQAVVRLHKEYSAGEPIVFKYMSRMFDNLGGERPLQLSFLLVHEWLWSLSSEVDRNRRINWFLHSEEFGRLSRVEVISRLKGMGLDVKAIPRIVDAEGNGHFRSLRTAIEEARSGETLILKPGIYSTGNTPITRPLIIRGEGAAEDIVIRGSRNAPALVLQSEFHVENLTVTVPRWQGHVSTYFSERPVMVSLEEGWGTFRGVRFLGKKNANGVSAYVGITGAAEGKDLLVEDCTFSSLSDGLRLQGMRSLRVRNSHLEKNGETLSEVEVDLLEVTGSTFLKNYNAIFLPIVSSLRITGNTFIKNKKGFSGRLQEGHLIEGNIFEKNQVGVSLESKGAGGVLRGNRFAAHWGAAISLRGFHGTLEGNVVEKTCTSLKPSGPKEGWEGGIHAGYFCTGISLDLGTAYDSDPSPPTLVGNRIEASVGYGMVIRSRAPARETFSRFQEDNEFVAGGKGLYFWEKR